MNAFLVFAVAWLAPLAPVETPASVRAGAPARQAAAEEPGQLLGLADGRILWGSVESHDEAGLDVVRLDNGGRVRLPWDLLDPRIEKELRAQLGYLDVAEEEVLVQADLLRTLDGREVIGLIVHHSDDAIHVKTAHALMAIPKALIDGPSTLVRAPALDVFTRPELYQRELASRRSALEAPGAAGAAAHFDLAQFCERVLDHANAALHYRRAQELEPSFRPSDLAAALARAERKAAAQEQVDYLEEIRRERQRKDYERARALIEAFPTLYPESPLAEELVALARSVERAREEDLREAVERSWHHHAVRLAQGAARELDFGQASTWVAERMGEEIVALVHTDLLALDPALPVERVRVLWSERDRRGVHRASYGQGTWLLGEERARAGLAEPAPEGEGPSEREVAREDLEERLKRFLAQQRTVLGGGSRSDEADPAEFWETWTNAGRAQWLVAHYAEFSGDVELAGVHFANCGECGGTGVREIDYSGPGVSGSVGQRTQRIACPTCQHVGIVRRVTFR